MLFLFLYYQTANRFSDPGSKLACYRWYEDSLFSQLKNFINFPDEDLEKLHLYYRSLDYLLETVSFTPQELASDEIIIKEASYNITSQIFVFWARNLNRF